MTKSLFLFDQHEQYDRHTLLPHFEDTEQADKLVEDGKAVFVDLGQYDHYQDEASRIHDKFNADVTRIKENDNPVMTKEIKAYEIEKLEKEYEQANKQIKADYSEYREKQIEDARVKVAQATVDVTDEDKQTADQFATRSALTLATTTDTTEALMEIGNNIDLLTDGQRTALQSHVVGLLETVEGNGSIKHSLIDSVQRTNSQQLLSLRIAEQLPMNPAVEYNQRNIIKDMNKNRASEKQSAVSREFYEKYLKVGRK